MKTLYILGIGPGDQKLLTGEAKKILQENKYIMMTEGLRKRFSGHGGPYSLADIHKALEINEKDNIVLLVSGDPGFYSLANGICEKFQDRYHIHLVSGVNSLAYFSNKILKPYHGVEAISLHGRNGGTLLGKVAYLPQVFVLTGGDWKAHIICRFLCENGLPDVMVTVGENLSYENERIITAPACGHIDNVYEDLAILHIENKRYINPYHILKDQEFVRGNTPMTKEEIRSIALGKLDIAPWHTVVDIGAGTGAMSVAMAYKAYNGMVFAIEKNENACGLVEKNRKKHGAWNIKIIQGQAKDEILRIPLPDRAFIGGSGGELKEIIKALKNINPEIRIVVTVITMENLLLLRQMDMPVQEMICVNVAGMEKIAGYHMMKANNPVYVVVV